MREILFRGKRKDNGAWLEGYYHYSPRYKMHHIEWFGRVSSGDGILPQHRLTEVIPETVGQYTGLKDKNGKRIFEGDVCSTDLSRPYLVVEFRNGCFMYQCEDNGETYYDIMTPIEPLVDADEFTEVIGNIHDNPELQEGGAE